MDVAGNAPSPKSQKYDHPPPVLPVFVKLIGVLAHWGALEVKLDVGVWLIFMFWVAVLTHPDVVWVVVSVTVLIPGVE